MLGFDALWLSGNHARDHSACPCSIPAQAYDLTLLGLTGLGYTVGLSPSGWYDAYPMRQQVVHTWDQRICRGRQQVVQIWWNRCVGWEKQWCRVSQQMVEGWNNRIWRHETADDAVWSNRCLLSGATTGDAGLNAHIVLESHNTSVDYRPPKNGDLLWILKITQSLLNNGSSEKIFICLAVKTPVASLLVVSFTELLNEFHRKYVL